MKKIIKFFFNFTKKILFFFFLFPLLTPVIIILRALKPLIHIRFRYISTDQIGHFADDASIILAQRILSDKKKYDLFWLEEKPSNYFFVRLFKRQFIGEWWVKYFFLVNKIIPGGNKFTVLDPRTLQGSRDINLTLYNSKNDKNAFFSFTREENIIAREFLYKKGLKDSDKFVCLLVRDESYKKKIYPNHDWSYHDYRNSDINLYLKGINELADMGYWIFRMGSISKKKINSNHNKVIDYSFDKYKNDFLDIWLMANCNFCITTGSGIDSVAVAFRRPMLFLNFAPIIDIVSYTNSLTYPKRLRYKNDENFLNLDQCLRYSFYNTSEYKNNNIDIIDMSEDEIKNAIIEMYNRVSGKYKKIDNEDSLQKIFWDKILKSDEKHFIEKRYIRRRHNLIHPYSKISTKFLIDNPKWLN